MQFVASYTRLALGGLIYNPPRFPQFSYNRLDDALRHNEFRFIEIIDDDGLTIYKLEHEIRTLNHPGFASTRLPDDGGEL